MTSCSHIELERIYATITIGKLQFTTPRSDSLNHIMSFSINRSVNQPATCSAQVMAAVGEAGVSQVAAGGEGKIVIEAGVNDQEVLLFTGYITGVKARPHWQDARKMVLEINGTDVLLKLQQGGKFSRRVKLQDTAFAIITGGTRRAGGSMATLKRIPPGNSGIVLHTLGSDDTASDHSPLVKTPDAPGGTSSTSSNVFGGSSQQAASLNFELPNISIMAGHKVEVGVVDQSKGDLVDLNSLRDVTECLCFVSPPQPGTTGAVKLGENAFPIKVDIGSDGTRFAITITGDYPSKLTFVHPTTGANCAVNFQVIPPHDHRDIARGGPAVGSFDVFQI